MNIINNPASLTFENINYTYQRATGLAVEEINLTIDPGQLVVLVGPSGCGKSTLLRIVAGLIEPDRGRLLIDGQDMLGTPPQKRHIGWVPQSYALFEHLSVADNIAFGLRMQGMSKAMRKERVQAMLDLCHIPELAQRPVSDLSGGQRQRVAIARALAVQPRVLLLDEPLAALDPQLRVTLRSKLEILLRKSGVTTLFVTHDQSEALAIADRIAVLRAGRLEQYDTPEQLWNRPINQFVASFISHAQVVSGQRVGASQIQIIPGLVATANTAHLNGSDTVKIALRPTDLQVDSGGVRVVVTASEYAGGNYLIMGQVPDGPQLSFYAEQELSTGATVPIRIRPGINVAVVGS